MKACIFPTDMLCVIFFRLAYAHANLKNEIVFFKLAYAHANWKYGIVFYRLAYAHANWEYGNCYTLNSGRNESIPVWTSTNTGSNYGMCINKDYRVTTDV